jgi:hypothetical protein
MRISEYSTGLESGGSFQARVSHFQRRDAMRLQQAAQWTEISASIAVVATLVFLVQEVRQNTRELRFQADQVRGEMLSDPFFEAPELAAVLAKIKAVDGPDPLPQALVKRYDLSYEEAELWSRHLYAVWQNLEADFRSNGPSEKLRAWIVMLLESPDQQLYWQEITPSDESSFLHGSGFRMWVDGLQPAG